MEKVVSKGIKIDLHIHSEYSKNKDGKKVEENTLNNLPVLVKRLIENEVAMLGEDVQRFRSSKEDIARLQGIQGIRTDDIISIDVYRSEHGHRMAA